jgi:hypothetical protein
MAVVMAIAPREVSNGCSIERLFDLYRILVGLPSTARHFVRTRVRVATHGSSQSPATDTSAALGPSPPAKNSTNDEFSLLARAREAEKSSLVEFSPVRVPTSRRDTLEQMFECVSGNP